MNVFRNQTQTITGSAFKQARILPHEKYLCQQHCVASYCVMSKLARHSRIMSIGKTIKGLRLNKGWSQEELAHRVGTTTPSISRIETGKHGANDQLKQLIAQEFGLKVSELVALSEVDKSSAKKPAMSKSEEEEQTLLRYFRKMRMEKRELFKTIGRIFSER
jgi:transcriptional regulator with XRE-family HTH domain